MRRAAIVLSAVLIERKYGRELQRLACGPVTQGVHLHSDEPPTYVGMTEFKHQTAKRPAGDCVRSELRGVER